MIEINKIYHESNLETLSKIPDNYVDVVVTSPPYNKGHYADKNARKSSVWSKLDGRKIAYDSFSDDMEPDEYYNWQTTILQECLRILKPTGSIFYNHKDVINHGVIVAPTWVYQFNVHQQIIWDRASSPMLDPRYFMPVNEWIYWIVKDPKQVIFNKDKSCFRTNIWRMNVDKNPHPAPFPLLLAENCIATTCPLGGA